MSNTLLKCFNVGTMFDVDDKILIGYRRLKNVLCLLWVYALSGVTHPVSAQCICYFASYLGQYFSLKPIQL